MGRSRLAIRLDRLKGFGEKDSRTDSFRRHTIVLLILVVCALLSFSPLLSVVSLLVFSGWFIFLLFNGISFVLKYLYVFFAVLTMVGGCATIELLPSINLVELGKDGAYAGSLPLLVLCSWLLLAVLQAYDARWGIESDESDDVDQIVAPWRLKLMNAAGLVVLLVVIVSFVSVAPNPSFVRGIDRFTYERIHEASGIMKIMKGLLPYAMLVSGLCLRYGRKLIGALSIAVYCLYLFWTGEKFGGFFLLACEMIFVYFDVLRDYAARVTKKLVLAVLVGAMALLVLACFSFSFTNNMQIDKFLSYRLSAQGQLWWNVYATTDGVFHPEELGDEIDALVLDGNAVSSNVGANNGIYKMMYFSAPEDVVSAKLARGSRYSGAGFASAYYYLGPLGVVLFAVFIGTIVAVVTNALIRALRQRRLVDAILLGRLFSVVLVVYDMFLFSEFFRPLTALSIAWLLGGWILRSYRESRFRSKGIRE